MSSKIINNIKGIISNQPQDPFSILNSECKMHSTSESEYTWYCNDCKKFMCTLCYSKEHKNCWADIIENFKEEMLKTNEVNLETLKGIAEEFNEEAEFLQKKYDYMLTNNPFEINRNLINKIYDDLISLIEIRRRKSLKDLNDLKKKYFSNIEENIQKVNEMLVKTKEIQKNLVEEIEKIKNKSALDFCKDLSLKKDETSRLIDECVQVSNFQRQEFNKIKQSHIDANSVVFNDTNSIIDQCKNFRAYLSDKISGFYTNYYKYQTKYAFTVVMNEKQLIVYLIDKNLITQIFYVNDFVIPCFSRWLNISGHKLILTGGEKEYIESLNSTYLIDVKRDEEEDIFTAKVYRKADMIYRRRAHTVTYLNDYMY